MKPLILSKNVRPRLNWKIIAVNRKLQKLQPVTGLLHPTYTPQHTCFLQLKYYFTENVWTKYTWTNIYWLKVIPNNFLWITDFNLPLQCSVKSLVILYIITVSNIAQYTPHHHFYANLLNAWVNPYINSCIPYVHILSFYFLPQNYIINRDAWKQAISQTTTL